MKKLWLAGLSLVLVIFHGNLAWAATPYKSIPDKNQVVASIQKKIPSLRLPDRTAATDVKIYAESSVPSDAIQSISLQHQYMVQAFPEVFKWGKNSFYIYVTRKGASAEATKQGCVISDEFKDTFIEPPTMNSITQPCGDQNSGHNTISFLNWPSYKKYDPALKRTSDGVDMWSFQAGQEGDGSLIQSYYYAGKSDAPNGNPMPAWYEQGGQFALSSVALATEKRQWRQSSLMQGRVDTCNGAKLKTTFFYNSPENQRSCHYQLGAIAAELMVALYGFDAPVKWLQNSMVPQSASDAEKMNIWKSSFKISYGDSLDKFLLWSDAYAKYLSTNGKAKLPAELLSRL